MIIDRQRMALNSGTGVDRCIKKMKRPHKTLSTDQKLEILHQGGKKSYALLSEEYGIGHSTIASLKKQEMELWQDRRKMKEMGIRRPATIMKLGRDEELEKAIYLWFCKKKEQRIQITGIHLQQSEIKLGTCSSALINIIIN